MSRFSPFARATLFTLAMSTVVFAAEPPREWIDPDTGHRVVRLSDEPGTASLYFHQDAFTRDGTRTIVITPHGLATINLTTRETKLIVPDAQYRVESSAGIEVGRKTGRVYYLQDHAVWSVDPDTLERHEVVKLPADGTMSDLNADETLIVGATTEPDPHRPQINTWPPPGTKMHAADGRLLTFAEMREVLINQRLEQRVPMTLFTLDLRTGEQRTILRTTDWIGHIQFSPTDPSLILFCHEGNWHQVDRTWAVRADGSGLKLLHYRTMPYEIEGHEFFSFDGAMAYYDLQTPRSGQFWLAGVHLATGDRVRYPLERVQWSVHYNQSHDGKLFSGDGGGPNSVANRTPLPDNKPLDPPGNGMWMYLFTPQDVPAETLKVGDDTIKIGKLSAERLVNLSMHDYTLEPNGVFSPDNKWLIFRSNMSGASHVYAVELRKSAEVK